MADQFISLDDCRDALEASLNAARFVRVDHLTPAQIATVNRSGGWWHRGEDDAQWLTGLRARAVGFDVVIEASWWTDAGLEWHALPARDLVAIGLPVTPADVTLAMAERELWK